MFGISMEVILMLFILAISAFNMLMLMDSNSYEHHDEYDTLDNNQLSESLYNHRIVVEDMQERLTILEDSFKYHIQTTDELKPKA